MATCQMSEVIQHLRRALLLRDGARLTDGELLADYLSRRDEAGFAALVGRHGPMVWGVCRRVLSNLHDAEDAFQATFLVLVRKAESIASRELLANWLYGVAHQTALNARATAARRRARERQVTEMPEPEVVQQDLWRDLQPMLDQELSRLPDKYRIPIVLCDLEGKTRKEAAQRLAWPAGTVAGRLARARVLLAKRLARRGLALSGGALATMLSQNVASSAVPDSLVVSTVKAATGVAAGSAAAVVVSDKVAAITEGVLKIMLLNKIKVVTMTLFMIAVLGAGLVGLTRQTQAVAQAESLRAGVALLPTSGQPASGDKVAVGKELWKAAGLLEGHEKPVLCVAFGPVPVLVTGDEGGQVRVWDTAAKKSLTDFKNGFKKGPEGRAIIGITYAADNSWVSFRETNIAHLAYDKSMKDGKPLGFGKGIGGDTSSLLAMTSDAKTYAVRKNASTSILIEEKDIKNLKAKLVNPNDLIWCKGHEKEPACAAFAPDDTLLLTGSADKTARLWDAASGAPQHTLSGHTDAVVAVVFSSDGKLVATGGNDGLVKLWDVKTGREIVSLRGHTVVRAVAFAPDGKTLASGGEDLTLRVWEVPTGRALAALPGHKETILTVGFSRDGTLLASGGRDKTIRLWKKQKQ
jgi:RNA polymerase sigma factor (sigma-70 family)